MHTHRHAEETEQAEYLASGTMQPISQLFGVTPHSGDGQLGAEMDAMDGVSVETRARTNLSSPVLQLRDSCPLYQNQHQAGPQDHLRASHGANSISSPAHSADFTSVSLPRCIVSPLKLGSPFKNTQGQPSQEDTQLPDTAYSYEILMTTESSLAPSPISNPFIHHSLPAGGKLILLNSIQLLIQFKNGTVGGRHSNFLFLPPLAHD